MLIKKKNALFGRYPSCDMLNNAIRLIDLIKEGYDGRKATRTCILDMCIHRSCLLGKIHFNWSFLNRPLNQ